MRNFHGAHRNSGTANTKHSNIQIFIKNTENLTWPRVPYNKLVWHLWIKEVLSSFLRIKRSSNGVMGLHNVLKIRVTESGRIFNKGYHNSN